MDCWGDICKCLYKFISSTAEKQLKIMTSVSYNPEQRDVRNKLTPLVRPTFSGTDPSKSYSPFSMASASWASRSLTEVRDARRESAPWSSAPYCRSTLRDTDSRHLAEGRPASTSGEGRGVIKCRGGYAQMLEVCRAV